jgi:RNA polymerase sigma-70 factor (ECF subfamily)
MTAPVDTESPLDAEAHRREIVAYCYRFLGNYAEAEDAAQETMLRAWQHGEAFEALDVDRLVELLAEDAAFSMPPFTLWLRGAEEIERWWRGPGQVCRNSRTIVTHANGQPSVAVYHDVGDGRWEPFAIHVLDTNGGRIRAITQFMGSVHFEEFGLPDGIREAPGSGGTEP